MPDPSYRPCGAPSQCDGAPPRGGVRPLLRLARRPADPGSRRQRDRRGRRDGPRDRRAGKRVRGLRRCRAGDDPPRRTRRDPCDQRRRRLAEGRRHRAFPSELRRAHPRGPAALRGSRRAEHLDRRPGALRHDVVRRGGGGGDPLRARGFPDLSVPGRAARRPAERLRALAEHGRHLPAQRTAARGGRDLRARRSRPHAAIHGGSGAGACPGRSPRRPEGGARCVLSRRHRRRDRAPSAGERRLADRARSRRVPQSDRTAVPHPLRRVRRAMAAAPGRRGRWCWRRWAS